MCAAGVNSRGYENLGRCVAGRREEDHIFSDGAIQCGEDTRDRQPHWLAHSHTHTLSLILEPFLNFFFHPSCMLVSLSLPSFLPSFLPPSLPPSLPPYFPPLGCAMSGLIADSKTMVDKARVDAQHHWFVYNEPMSVESVTQSISNLAMEFGEDSEEKTMVCVY